VGSNPTLSAKMNPSFLDRVFSSHGMGRSHAWLGTMKGEVIRRASSVAWLRQHPRQKLGTRRVLVLP
jgi:hypothetical protein